jgi:DNA-binding CsgD family transcriptional regulator
MFGGDRYGKRVPNDREQRVIELVAQGLKNSEVGEAIGTTENVVKNYLRVIYDKLGLWNRVELALWYEARRHEIPAHIRRRNDTPFIVPKPSRILGR